MADAVLVQNPSDPNGTPLLAYPVTVTNSDGASVTGLAFANIITGKAADDQGSEMIALLQAILAAQTGVTTPPVTTSPAAGSADFSIAGNPLAGAVA